MIERYGEGRPFEVTRSTMKMLERYAWPGNVRELENAVQRAIALAGEQRRLEAEGEAAASRNEALAAAVQDAEDREYEASSTIDQAREELAACTARCREPWLVLRSRSRSKRSR